MSNDNLLHKLRQKNRQRATVPHRQDALMTAKAEPEAPLESEPIPTQSPTVVNREAILQELKSQLAQFPQTRRRSGIVLEQELDQQLTTYCKQQGITVETFLEAAWQVTSAQEHLLTQITQEAKERYAIRKEAGHLRRLITTLEQQ